MASRYEEWPYAYSATVPLFELCKLLSRKEAFGTELELDLLCHLNAHYLFESTAEEVVFVIDAMVAEVCDGP